MALGSTLSKHCKQGLSGFLGGADGQKPQPSVHSTHPSIHLFIQLLSCNPVNIFSPPIHLLQPSHPSDPLPGGAVINNAKPLLL